MKGMGGVVSCPFDRLGTHNTASVCAQLSDCEDIRDGIFSPASSEKMST